MGIFRGMGTFLLILWQPFPSSRALSLPLSPLSPSLPSLSPLSPPLSLSLSPSPIQSHLGMQSRPGHPCRQRERAGQSASQPARAGWERGKKARLCCMQGSAPMSATEVARKRFMLRLQGGNSINWGRYLGHFSEQLWGCFLGYNKA